MANPLGSAPGVILGVGLGAAASVAIEPIIEPARQQAWKNNRNRILDPPLYAALVAQGAVTLDAGRIQAHLEGFADDKFDALVYLAQRAPDLALTLELWRRGLFGDPKSGSAVALVDHALAKEQIETQYWSGIKELFNERLAPPVVALAIVRGLMTNPGILPVGPPSSEGNVKAFPVSGIDPLLEAQALGFDKERLAVLAGIAGRPMGPEQAASAVFRSILQRVDYDRAISEGDVRNEWADAIFETARQIPSVADYVALHLRGHTDTKGMHDGAARHGMSAADSDLIYLARGRPAAPGQMATAVARGIDGPLGKPMDREQFLLGIAESDIRPEWGPMLFESRFLYPPLFQLSRLVAAGSIDAATAAGWAEKDRYAPEVVTALRASWEATTGGATATDPHISKAQTQLWATTHRSYIANEVTATVARTKLGQAGVSAAAIPVVIGVWDHEKELIRKQLTPAQIKKALAKSSRNAATGTAWTRDEALAALIALGYDVTTANDYLDIP